MATTISTGGDGPKPVLSARITGFKDKINAAFLLRKDDGVLTVCDDKSVRVWLKRDSGQYWPSIHHMMPYYHEESSRLFVGMENGTVAELILAEDFNSLRPGKEFFSHTGAVTAVRWCMEWEWLLSVGKDKSVVWECSETGRRLGSFPLDGWCTCLQFLFLPTFASFATRAHSQVYWRFDAGAKYAFVGDYAGSISVLKLQENSCERITKLSAHTGEEELRVKSPLPKKLQEIQPDRSIRSLAWDVERSQLYSASNDNLIICWDIGGKQGKAIEMTAHKRKVTSLAYWAGRAALFSGGDGGRLVAWDCSVTRKETPAWSASDSCERCDAPFFWNIKSMWERRTVGLRQHHCRLCGKAVCWTCSEACIRYPPMGYEIEVRVCKDCQARVETEISSSSASSSSNPLKPLATFHDVGHSVLGLDLDPIKGRLLSYGTDRVIKIWDVSEIMKP